MPLDGQGGSGQERQKHPRDAQLPQDVDLAMSSVGTSPQSARKGMSLDAQNGAQATASTASPRKATIFQPGRYFIFSRALARHLASSLFCSGVMLGTIIGKPARGMIDQQQRDAVNPLQNVGLHNQVGRAVERQFAVPQGDDPIALQHGMVQVVGHGHDGNVKLFVRQRHQRQDFGLVVVIEESRRFVEQPDMGALGQRRGNIDLLTLAAA